MLLPYPRLFLTGFSAIEAGRSLVRADLSRVAYCEPPLRADEVVWLEAEGFTAVVRPELELSAQLEHAFFRAFHFGARGVVATTTGNADVSSEILAEAFDALVGGDAAIGPSEDGGYYLIGLPRPCRQVFRGIPWDTDRVLFETMGRLRGCGYNLHILPPRCNASHA